MEFEDLTEEADTILGGSGVDFVSSNLGLTSRRRILDSRRRAAPNQRPVTKTYTRADFASPQLYASWLLTVTASRRRYNTYISDPSDGCVLLPDYGCRTACAQDVARDASDVFNLSATSSSLTEWSQATCLRTSMCCDDCMVCEDDACMNNVFNCSNFLSDIYTACVQTTYEENATSVWAVIGWIAFCVAIACGVAGVRWMILKRQEAQRQEVEREGAVELESTGVQRPASS